MCDANFHDKPWNFAKTQSVSYLVSSPLLSTGKKQHMCPEECTAIIKTATFKISCDT